MIQLAKTGWLEEILPILEGVRIHVVSVVVALNHYSGCFHEIEGNGCDLKLKGAITGRSTVLICITIFFAVVLVLLGGTASRIVVSATAHLSILHWD